MEPIYMIRKGSNEGFQLCRQLAPGENIYYNSSEYFYVKGEFWIVIRENISKDALEREKIELNKSFSYISDILAKLAVR